MKKFVIITLCLSVLAVSTLAFAEDVYVTQHGKKFHKADCQLVKNREKTTMDQAEAEKNGLEPCGKCFKAKAIGDQSKVNQKKTSKETQ